MCSEDYAKGYAEGYAKTYREVFVPDADDPDEQHGNPYNEVYRNGCNQGRIDFRAQGYTQSYTDCYARGYAKGRADFYARTYAMGYAKGYHQGYALAYARGYVSTYAKDFALPYAQGYTLAYTNFYAQGRAKDYVRHIKLLADFYAKELAKDFAESTESLADFYAATNAQGSTKTRALASALAYAEDFDGTYAQTYAEANVRGCVPRCAEGRIEALLQMAATCGDLYEEVPASRLMEACRTRLRTLEPDLIPATTTFLEQIHQDPLNGQGERIVHFLEDTVRSPRSLSSHHR